MYGSLTGDAFEAPPPVRVAKKKKKGSKKLKREKSFSAADTQPLADGPTASSEFASPSSARPKCASCRLRRGTRLFRYTLLPLSIFIFFTGCVVCLCG